MAEIEVEGKGGTKLKARSAQKGGVVLTIYTGEGEVSAPAIWLETEQVVEEVIGAIKQAQEEQGYRFSWTCAARMCLTRPVDPA